MKGIKSVNMTKLLRELNELKASAEKINSPDYVQAFLVEDGSWHIIENFSANKKYRTGGFSTDNFSEIFKYKDHPNLSVIVDDMLMNCEIYLPTTWIYYEGKDTIKQFIDIIASGDEIELMNAYISLFDRCFGIPEPDYIQKYPNSVFYTVDGEWVVQDEDEYKKNRKRHYDNSIEVVREVLEKEPVLLDFFDNYKILSVEELIERYKDQRFFNLKEKER